MLVSFRGLLRESSLILGLYLGNTVWGAPTIQSVVVSPTPLAVGQGFTVSATASQDVTQGTATVDFRPAAARLLRVPLAKQGPIWTGSGLVPADLQLPAGAGAMVKVLLFDASRQKAEQTVAVGVSAAPVSAVFAGGVLTVTGDNQDNSLTVSRDAAGTLLVNGGSLPVTGGIPTVANTSRIRIFGLGGNDILLMDDTNGPLPPASLFGGQGDDTLTGSANADELDGGPGNDTLFGRDGNDHLIGGEGNDILVGGRGNDVISGGEGDDQIVWNPGDGSDVVEGDGGEDTLVFNGANIGEIMDFSANGSRLRFFRNVGNITMDCAGVERVLLRALGGADQVTVNDLTGTDVTGIVVDLSSIVSGTGDGQSDTVVVNGTEEDDHITVAGSATGVEVLGLTAAVTIVGAEQGLDALVINARGGSDVVDFVGSDEGENVDFSANGQRLRFFSNLAQIETECDGVEQANFRALEGADRVTVNDLTGTQVTRIGIDLSGHTPGTGDGQADTVVVNGTQANDVITVSGSAAATEVVGLAAAVTIVGAEPGLDRLEVNALGGADTIDAAAVDGGGIQLTLNGGDGDDVLVGGEGNDLLIGGRGQDTVFGGGGDDTFVWNPGDGSDVLQGDAGADTLLFNGANISENVDLSANGSRLRFFRNVANITMDCADVERVRFNALGGADTITVNDLTGTGVTSVVLDLAAPPGSGAGDNQADTVIVNATTGDDSVVITGTSAGVDVRGLTATVSIFGSEGALDQLLIHLLGGDDVVEASGLQAGVIGLTVDGGPGADVLIGSAGADVLLGGEGDDVLEGGPGNDVLDGGPGDNVLIQD